MDMNENVHRRATRSVRVGGVVIGGGADGGITDGEAIAPIVFQSMCATKTTDAAATAAMVIRLTAAGAGIVRVAVDTPADAAALVVIRRILDDDPVGAAANLSIDLQENWLLIEAAAPAIQKARYNPGHLHHRDPATPWQEKVRRIADVAGQYNLALRVGVNCGSVDPALREKFPRGNDTDGDLAALLASAVEHCEFLDRIGFTRYCVSLKDSDPATVVALNRRFAAVTPMVPIHLGVTEAGMPPEAIRKTRRAFEPLLRDGIGETLRVSLTVPNAEKTLEIDAAREIVADVAAGRFSDADMDEMTPRLDIVSCPSCARVENERFVELAREIRRQTRPFERLPVRIAVMGCRVNGPGETDDADLGLWCGPDRVHLKRGTTLVGIFGYDEIIGRFLGELRKFLPPGH